MHWLHKTKYEHLPTIDQRADLCIPSEITIRICMCCMGSISNERYLKSWKSVKRKAARFVQQHYSKDNSETRMTHELGWKKLQDKIKQKPTINYTTQNNKWTS